MSDTQLAIPVKASDQLAAFLGIEKSMMLETLKAQCFKGKRPDEISDAQLAAFVSTANVLQVNPLVPGMLYAYPERNGGITPILGPDGVFKKLDEFIATGKLQGFECEVTCDKDGKPVRADATIYRGGDAKPAKYTAWFAEWAVTSNPNWSARPRHMLWVRAIKQAARQVIHGLPMDADEYAIAQMQNVTGTADETPAPAAETTAVATRPEPKKRSAKGAATVVENADKPAETVTTGTGAGQVIDIAADKITPAKEPEADAAKAHAAAQALKKDETDKAEAELFKAPVARAFLKDGETFETVITVKEVTTLIANIAQADGTKKATPSVKAQVSGGFVGEVYHFGGATAEGDKLKPLPVWTAGASAKAKLVGKMNKASGKVQVRVESITPEGSTGNAAEDVD